MSPDHPQRRPKRTRKIVGKPNLPGTLCPKCGKRFVPTPGMQNVSCCVAHAPGTCCHYSETEVGSPKRPDPPSARVPGYTTVDYEARAHINRLTALFTDAGMIVDGPPPTRWTRFRSWLADRLTALARWVGP